MEVTQSNFNSVLIEVQTAINNCTFLSIDCELTGLKTAVNSVNAFDSPKQYYEKIIKDCREFLVIQYGITLFRFDNDADCFKHKSYNFYTFRRPINKFIQDQRFLCQTSSVDFLIGNGFDFNKLFKDGIPYLNNVEEEKCRVTLEEQKRKKMEFLNSNFSGNNDIIPIPDEHKEFINKIIKTLEEFLQSEEPEIQLPKCNAFLRRLIYQTNTEKFHDKIQLETRTVEKDRILVASKLKSREERDEVEQKKFQKLFAQMENFIGFSKVIRMIIESGKLIVGHNLMLDFLHTIDKFLTPLPNDYLEFKECASSLFPNVLDTKYMSSNEPFKEIVSSTVLGQLLESLSGKPFDIPKYEQEEGGQGYVLNDNKEHEAGYDSFITGLCFLSMWKYIGSQKNWSNSDMFGKAGLRLLQPYTNKIFLMLLTDGQYLNLSGPDLNPSRDHVFYLTFPKEWTTNNIVQLFSPFGNVYVAWLTDSSAYVGLFKRDQAAVALKTLSQSDTYSIMTYAKRQALLTGQRAILPSPVKRRVSNEGPPQTKRRKTDSFNGSTSSSKRLIEPIEEEEQSEEETDDGKGETSKVKTFAECGTWD
ncbi:poly(A)-specific ribonuclease PARN-like [Euwallacea similis]|uniref:poly(A)-specific ribonuclease PARN-like n=1 Tax=Euwallacea similis TaxID=1736056 RepID=UPI00344EDE8B